LRESIGLYLKEANFIYNFILIRFNSFGKNINIIAMSERIFLVKKKFFLFCCEFANIIRKSKTEGKWKKIVHKLLKNNFFSFFCKLLKWKTDLQIYFLYLYLKKLLTLQLKIFPIFAVNEVNLKVIAINPYYFSKV
jgi:hypothetical protein